MNREIDTLKAIFSKAAEWRLLIENPAAAVKRFRIDNSRTRTLSDAEQTALVDSPGSSRPSCY